jgi:hypothetical protein
MVDAPGRSFKNDFFFFVRHCQNVRIVSYVNTDFHKFDNLSNRNVKLILMILSDFGPVSGTVR